jgi:hypothetical protein
MIDPVHIGLTLGTISSGQAIDIGSPVCGSCFLGTFIFK